VGGNIPHGDVDTLINLGAAAAFPTGTTVEEVVHYLKEIE
jgi:methylmalonyl-CoA mutase cobalamin-binding subunit